MSIAFGDFVIPPLLAQLTDLANWTGVTNPANATQILRACTSLILDATEGAYYDVDATTGLATDSQTANALRDATCIQAAAWIALAIDPSLAGVATTTVKTSKKIGTAAITYDVGDTAAASSARALAQTQPVPAAARMLQQNNLLGNGPYVL